MLTYILLFIIVLTLSFQRLRVDSKPNRVLFWFVMLSIGLFVGLSDMLGGYDRYIYGEVFDYCAREMHYRGGVKAEHFLFFFGHEWGYGGWNMLIGLISGNRYFFILATTLVCYALYARTFYKYSVHPYITLLIFMGLTFFFTFTYLRQVMAMGIVWMGLPFILNRKPIPFFALVALGASIHNSAALFSLLYFIPLRRFAPRTIILVMGGLLFLGLTNVTGSLFEAYGEAFSSAASKAAGYTKTASYGFRIEYLIEALLFLYIFLRNYQKLPDTKENALLMNFYLLFCGTLLFFARSSDGGRLAWYGSGGIMLLIPLFVQHAHATSLRNFATILSFVLFLRILTSWGILIMPYKTFLTLGVRDNDPAYEQYEYNHTYRSDKLQNFFW